MDKTINNRMFASRANGQLRGDAWSNSRSHQYQTVKPAPAPSSAYRIQALACHMPHNSTIPANSQIPPLKAMYNGPGGDAK